MTNAGACLRWLAIEPPNLAEASEAAQRIMRDGKRANDVLFRIRSLFQKGEPPPAPDSIDMNEAIREVISLCEREMVQHSSFIRTALADGLPLVSATVSRFNRSY